jgi:hypothetical protein
MLFALLDTMHGSWAFEEQYGDFVLVVRSGGVSCVGEGNFVVIAKSKHKTVNERIDGVTVIP